MTDRTVTDDPAASRFEVRVGDDVAGYARYDRRGDSVAFLHTVVESRFEGQGVGSALVRGALDAVHAQGLTVLPYCPFVRDWLQRHPDSLDLVPADRRAEFALAPGDPQPDQP